MPNQDDGPDFLRGVPLDTVPEGGLLAGTVGQRKAVLVRRGATIRALGAQCTHLGAPLAQGLVVGGQLRCPWHHACFDIETGRAVKAPAFEALPIWTVVIEGERVRVADATPETPSGVETLAAEGRFVIVGGGAAGYAAALALKEHAPTARCTLLSADVHAPYDRTILTKDYLDGKFGDEHLPISTCSLEEAGVDLRLGTVVARIDRAARTLVLAGGETIPYGKLLLATGAEPKRLDIPGADHAHVHVLRSLDDCRAILDIAGKAKAIVILGSSFIGLEAAASLRSRGLDITVVTPDQEPVAAVFGSALSAAVMGVHREKGTHFMLGRQARVIEPYRVTLDDGTTLSADLVIVGIGVAPRVDLAETAGLVVRDGVVVDAMLRTSDPDIFAAGDIARWPDARAGREIRVEHWAVAQRQGRAAALNMLGGSTAFEDVPFFWTKHFDLSIRYVGHAEHATVEVDGLPGERNATVTFRENGANEAVATIGRDLASLEQEHRMETLPRA